MGFNEKVHAYIAAEYYVHLTAYDPERGEAAFIHAVQYYGMQRGRRMAQRAIKDNIPLTPAAYYRYSEWMPSQEILALHQQNISCYLSYDPDGVMKITQCPWHKQFQEMGLCSTAGKIYCTYLDRAIVTGFNPLLTFEVPETLQTGSYCIQIMKNIDFNADTDLAKNPAYVKDFAFHCAHTWWSFREVSAAILGEAGSDIAMHVLLDFEKEYGKEMKDIIMSYEGYNFNSIDQE